MNSQICLFQWRWQKPAYKDLLNQDGWLGVLEKYYFWGGTESREPTQRECSVWEFEGRVSWAPAGVDLQWRGNWAPIQGRSCFSVLSPSPFPSTHLPSYLLPHFQNKQFTQTPQNPEQTQYSPTWNSPTLLPQNPGEYLMRDGHLEVWETATLSRLCLLLRVAVLTGVKSIWFIRFSHKAETVDLEGTLPWRLASMNSPSWVGHKVWPARKQAKIRGQGKCGGMIWGMCNWQGIMWRQGWELQRTVVTVIVVSVCPMSFAVFLLFPLVNASSPPHSLRKAVHQSVSLPYPSPTIQNPQRWADILGWANLLVQEEPTGSKSGQYIPCYISTGTGRGAWESINNISDKERKGHRPGRETENE